MQSLLFTEEIASVGPQSHFQANWSHRAELKCIHCSDFEPNMRRKSFYYFCLYYSSIEQHFYCEF